MCFVCENNDETIEMIKPFLKEGVEIRFKKSNQWQEIWLTDGENNALITADGDEGGYFHFSANKPEDWEDDIDADEDLDLVNIDAHGGWEFDLPKTLSVKEINSKLPGIALVRNGSDKCTHEWFFSYKGNKCAIWDYKGSRWSACGPKWCFEELGFILD